MSSSSMDRWTRTAADYYDEDEDDILQYPVGLVAKGWNGMDWMDVTPPRFMSSTEAKLNELIDIKNKLFFYTYLSTQEEVFAKIATGRPSAREAVKKTFLG